MFLINQKIYIIMYFRTSLTNKITRSQLVRVFRVSLTFQAFSLKLSVILSMREEPFVASVTNNGANCRFRWSIGCSIGYLRKRLAC